MASIETICNNQNGLPGPLVREFCFLQLRMICELIALDCLTAHGDIKGVQSKKLSKEYSADRILWTLKNLHSNYYPKPATLKSFEPGKHAIKNIEAGFLSMTDLPRLYAKCGDTLHRGNIKKLLSHKTSAKFSFPEIRSWTKKIITLLNIYHIHLIDGKTEIVCMMHAQKTGNVQVVIAEAIEDT